LNGFVVVTSFEVATISILRKQGFGGLRSWIFQKLQPREIGVAKATLSSTVRPTNSVL
jgi:hypothetical protein